MGQVIKENVHEVVRYHPPQTQERKDAHERIAQMTEQALLTILETCPECEDRETAIVCIREARMWANSAIALDGMI